MKSTLMSFVTKSAFVLSIVGVTFFTYAEPLEAQTESKVRVVGVSVTLPDPDNEYGNGAVEGRQHGTEVHIQVRNEKLFFTGLAQDGDEDKTSLKILDDKGRELKNESSFSSFGFGTKVSSDGHSVTFPVSANDLPPGDASSIQVKGTIVLVVAKDEKTEDVAIELKQGTKLKLGNVDVTISELEKDPYGDDGYSIGFESSKSMDAIAEIIFLDGSGKEMESSSNGGYSSGFAGNMTYAKMFSITGKTDKLSARVRYFQTTEELEVAVDLPVTLGIGE